MKVKAQSRFRFSYILLAKSRESRDGYRLDIRIRDDGYQMILLMLGVDNESMALVQCHARQPHVPGSGFVWDHIMDVERNQDVFTP
jgi:hypothetical protein